MTSEYSTVMLVVALFIILPLLMIVTTISESWLLIILGIEMVGLAVCEIAKYILNKK